jgi:hypothetical protein
MTAIPAVVQSKGPRVSFVDLYPLIQADDLLDDHVHLTALGESKLATAWYTAIHSLLGAPNAGLRRNGTAGVTPLH